MMDSGRTELARRTVDGRSVRRWGAAPSLALLALALAAAGLNLAATRYGPGMTSDSMTYLAASETWLAGLGLGRLSGPHGFKPMTHFPPLFPLLLAGGQMLGSTGIEAGRWINALLHAGTVLVAGLWLELVTRSPVAAVLGTVFVVLSPVLLKVEAQVMSEAAFLFLGFSGLWLLATASEAGNHMKPATNLVEKTGALISESKKGRAPI